MKKLLVSAAGAGSRIAPLLIQLNCPSKHLLPINKNETLLGSIIGSARYYFDFVDIYSAPYNDAYISSMIQRCEFSSFVSSTIDNEMSGPLGPLAREVAKSISRIYGCAGDFWASFSWEEFNSFHDNHEFPVSILLGKSITTRDGASFEASKDKVLGWKRGPTSDNDYINIGCYIIDPVPEILDYFASVLEHKEDTFFSYLIEQQLLAGFCLQNKAFNINSSESYFALVDYLQQSQKKL